MKNIMTRLVGTAIALSCSALVSGCSSAPPVKTEAYAQLSNHRTFEYDFPAVWKGIEATLRNYKIAERDPKEVGELAMRQLDHRSIETDWSYGQSRDKYEEYQVNGTPRKVYLQERTQFTVDARRVMGGVDVNVRTRQEVERIKPDGSSAGFESVSQPDPSRASELLDKINGAILSAPPSGAAP